jgi:hypothetical protein
LSNMRTRRTQADNISRILDAMTKRRIIEFPEEAFHVGITKKAQEKLRILNSKYPPNQPLCAGDSLAARSVIVLEFVLRKGIIQKDGGSEFRVDVPLEILGKEVGCQKKEIENLAHVVRSHLEGKNGSASRKYNETSKTSAKIKKMLGIKNTAKPKASKASKGKPSAHLKKQMEAAKAKRALSKRTRTTGISSLSAQSSLQSNKVSDAANLQRIKPVEPFHLHELAMKLQSKSHDPDACEKKSKELFFALVKFKLSDAESKAYNRKIHARKDFGDNLGMYEASCFFIASKEMEQGRIGLRDIDVARSQPDTAIRNGRKRARVSRSGIDSDEEDNADTLTIEDVARVLRETPSELSKFLKDVLPIVERMRIARKEEIKRNKQNEFKMATRRRRSPRRSTSVPEERMPDAQVPKPKRRDFIDSIVRKIDDNQEDESSAFTRNEPDSVKESSETIPPISPPQNRKALYEDQEAYDAWDDALFENLKRPEETREDMINRHFAEIIKRYENQ